MADHQRLGERLEEYINGCRDLMITIHDRPDPILRIDVHIRVPKEISDWAAAI